MTARRTGADHTKRRRDMRRRELLACLPMVLGAALPTTALAQSAYPGAPVKVLVGFPPGTAADMATRVVVEQMARRLGQPLVVDNRPGAGSNIAAKAVATSQDRKSTRLNSSHSQISYAVFCLKKKKQIHPLT